MLTAVVAATMLFSGAAPMALAASDATDQGSVVATRSFPKVSAVKKNILAESTSTEVEQDSDWGGVESLDVPQTKSQAEKDAEERAAAEQQAREQAAAQAQQTQQASRSADRSDLATDNSSSTSTVTVTPPNDASVSSLLTFAGQFVGKVPYVSGGNTPSGWDCSGFVQYVYGQMGVSLPHYSGAQATAGRAVGSLAEAQPGDIIANSQHAAIYVGNGMVINSQLNGTRYDPIAWVFTSSYSIRRIF
ncbi:C40 family peptidase [Bifidobacterium moukalabense]|uniref:C40 family peptidase n=1 Tax=Bifidobacterium moukalabense TaxID=1333651 RepID=UPI0010F7F4A8|nr:C40 family peptidase [Bifidobacterium moukalabense]